MPAINILGALSLIVFAILLTICGTFLIMSGSELAIPFARFNIRFRPESTNFPAFLLKFAVKLVNADNPLLINCCVPFVIPFAKLSIKDTPSCVNAVIAFPATDIALTNIPTQSIDVNNVANFVPSCDQFVVVSALSNVVNIPNANPDKLVPIDLTSIWLIAPFKNPPIDVPIFAQLRVFTAPSNI